MMGTCKLGSLFCREKEVAREVFEERRKGLLFPRCRRVSKHLQCMFPANPTTTKEVAKQSSHRLNNKLFVVLGISFP